MTLSKRLVLTVLLSLFMIPFCYAASPAGKWNTVDDKTGKRRAVMKLWVSNGVLYGKIMSVVKQPGDTGYCNNCKGKFKGKKVVGLTNMWGLKKTSKANVWDGGYILDPKNGKIYRCKVTVSSNGKKLTVRGYVGFSMLGRSQTWYRS